MTSTTDDTELKAIIRFWGHNYTITHDPDTHPGKPYTAHRKDRQPAIRAATPALLLDAIKDDTTTRPFTEGTA